MTKRELQQNEGRKFMYSKSKWRNKEWKNIVDNVLRTGGNRKNSVQRIIYEFMQNQKVHVEYIQEEFGVGGKGLLFDAKKYAVWFNENGIKISNGETTRDDSMDSVLINWNDVCIEIQKMLAEGVYQTQNILDQAYDNAVKELAERIFFMKREIVDEYWDILDVILKLNDHPGKEYDQIMPSNMDQLEERLRDSESSEKLGNLLKYISLEYQKHPEIVRCHFNSPDEICQMYERFVLKRKEFHANSDFIWKHPDIFITQDEIDEFLRRGGAYEDGKFKIYSFFLLHKDKTARSNFLKDRYGIGGCSHALCGADDSGADYNAKGLVLKRSVTGKEISIRLGWPMVADRVSYLIQNEQFLTGKEYLKLHDYEARVMADHVIMFYHRLPEDIVRPFEDSIFYDQTKREVYKIINSKTKFSKLLSSMKQDLQKIPKDFEKVDETYEKKERLFNELQGYHDGTYTLFPFQKPEKKEDVMSWTQMNLFDFI